MSTTTTVRWVMEKQFVGTDSNGHAVLMSGSDAAGGVKPSQMLLLGLSGCTAYDVLDIMQKKRKPISFLEISATGEQDQEPPWAYRQIHLLFRISGENLTEKAVSQAIDLSQKKYCSVAATVRGVAEITTAFEIVPTPVGSSED